MLIMTVTGHQDENGDLCAGFTEDEAKADDRSMFTEIKAIRRMSLSGCIDLSNLMKADQAKIRVYRYWLQFTG
jgi:hypothetical protein